MDNLLKAIKSTCTRLLDISPKLLDQLSKLKDASGQGFNLDVEVPSTVFSVNQHHQRLSLIITLANELSSYDRSILLVAPASNLNALRNCLDNLQARITETIQNRTSQFEPNGGVGHLSATDFTAQPPNGAFNLNLSEIYTFLQDNCDGALQNANAVLSIVNKDAPITGSGFSILGKLGEQVTQIGLHKEQAAKSATDAAQAQASAASAASAATDSANACKASADDISKSAGKAAEDMRKIAALLDEVEKINTRAKSLSDEVAAYEEKFRAFDGALDARNAEFKNWSEATAKLVASLKKSDDEAASTINKSQEALKWATVDGLSSGFTDEMEKRKWPLRFAEWTFYLSLAALAGSVYYLFTPDVQKGLPALSEIANGNSPVAVIVLFLSAFGTRILILLPSIMFLGFTYSRYKELFRSREYYSYKRTVAGAVPGFKAEAASIDASQEVKDVTVAAFERLLFDHVDNEVQKKTAREQINWLSALYYRFKKPIEDARAAIPVVEQTDNGKKI
jgi:hypothetical protein